MIKPSVAVLVAAVVWNSPDALAGTLVCPAGAAKTFLDAGVVTPYFADNHLACDLASAKTKSSLTGTVDEDGFETPATGKKKTVIEINAKAIALLTSIHKNNGTLGKARELCTVPAGLDVFKANAPFTSPIVLGFTPEGLINHLEGVKPGRAPAVCK